MRALPSLLGLTLTVIACGARPEITSPTAGSGGSGGGAPAGGRACLPNCTVGHACCVGGCGGPAAVTESACCTCLDGEVDSSTCPGAVCGGACTEAGEACEDGSECCSGVCDYPSADAEKKNCLIV